jgi:hypothetical protein
MTAKTDPEMLLGQSKEEYAKYLKCQDNDFLAEAGELLWESLKAYIIQETNTKTSNIKTLTMATSQLGETVNQLFFRCYHFHSWYSGGGVPNDFTTEKKLYLESAKSLEKMLNEVNCQRTKPQELKKIT